MSQEFLKKIGSNVKALRTKNGWSQEKLAEIAQINDKEISHIESGNRNITIDTLTKLSTALNKQPSDLLSFDFSNQTPISQLNRIFRFIRQFQSIADEQNIKDIFKNNGGKHLQVLIITGLINQTGHDSCDAKDRLGNEYELKSININLVRSFSTHHRMNSTRIKKYKHVNWVFAVYDGIELSEIYLLAPEQLKPYYAKWETKWIAEGKNDINNPKIPLKYVRENGVKIYTKNNTGKFYPSDITNFIEN